MNSSLAGTGYWGGNQNCAYQQRPAQAVSTESDEVRDAKEEIAELKQEIKEKTSEKKDYDRKVKYAKSDLKKSISEDYAEFMITHMESARSCSEYINFNQGDDGEVISRQRPPDGPPPEGFDGAPPTGDARPSRSGGANSNMLEVQAFSLQEWQSYCDARTNGSVFTAVCDNGKFRTSGTGSNASSCKSAIGTLRTNAQQANKLQGEIDLLQRKLERAQEDLKEARQNPDSEGTVCLECMAKSNSYNYEQPSSNLANLATGVLMGAGAMYAGYKTNQMITDSNANLGYPTQTPSVMSYGYPYIAQSLYGLMGNNSSGQGGFGCGGQMTGGMMGQNGMYNMMGNMGSSVFGYPSNMMNSMASMSGGIYLGYSNPMYNNSMYNNSMYSNSLNPYSAYGMTGYGSGNLNTVYGANAYGAYSPYASMNTLQQQLAQMSYQLSAMQSMTGSYGSGYGSYGYGYGTGSYISPTGLTNTTTTMPGGVIMGSTYGNVYTSPYVSTGSSTTIPGVVPMFNTTSGTTTTSGSIISGTGR